jgi:hypothetical protein
VKWFNATVRARSRVGGKNRTAAPVMSSAAELSMQTESLARPKFSSFTIVAVDSQYHTIQESVPAPRAIQEWFDSCGFIRLYLAKEVTQTGETREISDLRERRGIF